MIVQYVRVMPHADMGALAVPLGDGRMVTRADSPADGHLVMDSHFVRRRIQSGELVLLAEGAAATAEPGEHA